MRRLVTLTYLVTFFYAVHYSLTLYVESSFLSSFVGEGLVGLIYAGAAVLSIAFVLRVPVALRRFGNRAVATTIISLELLFLIALSFADTAPLAVALFIGHQVALAGFFVCLSVLLESMSVDRSTGATRGLFLTILNAAIIAGPFVAGPVVETAGLPALFIYSAAALVPVLLLLPFLFRGYREPTYRRFRILETLGRILTHKNISRIMAVQFLLEFFYLVMVVFTPVYLSEHVGIPLGTVLGVIMPVALLPFILFPYLLGKVADTRFGEKELLVSGFLILGLATMSLSFVATASVFVWALLLFITRVGATTIETMAETHFFKQVDASDASIISFYRNLRPFAAITAPLSVAIFLQALPLRYIFAALGLFLLSGIVASLRLRDTR